MLSTKKYWLSVAYLLISSISSTVRADNWEAVGSEGFLAGEADFISLALSDGVPYVAYTDWGNGYKATVMKYVPTNEEPQPNPPMGNTSTNLLEFSPLKEFYRIGEEIVLSLYEYVHASSRFHRVDLWVAVEVPADEFYFRTPSWFAPFSTSPQPFKRSLENLEVTDPILNVEVIPGMGGTYTFYALLVQEGTNPTIDGFSVQRSNLAIISTTLAD